METRTRRLAGTLILAALAAFILIQIFSRLDLTWLYSICPGPRVRVPEVIDPADANRNGIPDALDLVNGARGEVRRHTRYHSAYYAGGYPPEGLGACTDVIWRAFREAGVNLKDLVDADIKASPESYGSTGREPDPAIDFRRVRNLRVFFSRHAVSLPVEVRPRDVSGLALWQAGDIVIFAGRRYDHIGVVSPVRRPDGVPLIIHNAGPWASESDILLRWPAPIVGHFRFYASSTPPSTTTVSPVI